MRPTRSVRAALALPAAVAAFALVGLVAMPGRAGAAPPHPTPPTTTTIQLSPASGGTPPTTTPGLAPPSPSTTTPTTTAPGDGPSFNPLRLLPLANLPDLVGQAINEWFAACGMPMRLRIATFNLENLDDQPNQHPTLAERIALMGPQLARLDADILCLQEVNAHKTNGQFQLSALDTFLAGTQYATYHRAAAFTPTGTRSLVILSRFAITDQEQVLHTLSPAPSYQRVTAIPQTAPPTRSPGSGPPCAPPSRWTPPGSCRWSMCT